LTTPKTVALVLAALFTMTSCEEPFSPKEPFAPEYFLYCIANYDPVGASVQYAVVSHSYDVSGTRPEENTEDPFVADAEVQLTVGGTRYSFAQKRGGASDTTRYGTPRRVYYARDAKIIPGDGVSVTAYIPNGPTLTGKAVVPTTKPMESSPRYVVGFSTSVNRYTYGNSYVLTWEDGSHEEHLFFPSLTITYYRYDSTGAHVLARSVPLKYVVQGGSRVPVYPTVMTEKALSFEFDAIDEAMRAISVGDTAKSNYAPLEMQFKVIECDFPLSRYYASVNGYMDQYSIRLDESIFTNVQGGRGVVGSTNTYGINYEFDPRYVRSFGYRKP
jgi:hypothetical protein